MKVLIAVWGGNVYQVTKPKVEVEKKKKVQNKTPTLLQYFMAYTDLYQVA